MSREPATNEFGGTRRFTLLGRLGEGGMGVVHRARDEDTGAVVALKTMSRLEPAGLLRFKNEFRSLADIVHPNVVQLYELISDGEHWFFTMELVSGVDFLSYVRESRAPSAGWSTGERRIQAALPTAPEAEVTPLPATISPLEACWGARDDECCNFVKLRRALAGLVQGVSAIHTAGKLHLDVKPSNVMVEEDGRVVLLDFGVVAELGRPTVRGAGRAVGTPAYMAPEQAGSVRVGPAADFYAIGVMVYEALTGRLPFEGSLRDVLAAKQSALPPAPSRFKSGIPRDLEEIVVRLLRPAPGERPGGCEVLSVLAGRDWSPPASAIGASGAVAFVGRGLELAALHAARAEVASGRAALVLLCGASGMGKSALAGEFLQQAAAAGHGLVLSGRCFEREALPFKGMDSVIDELSRHLMQADARDVERCLPHGVGWLARVFPVLRSVPAVERAYATASEIAEPIELRRRAFSALRALLSNLAEQGPLTIHVDDVQWSDVDTIALLEELLRPPDAPRVLWLWTFREEARGTSPAVEGLLALGRRVRETVAVSEIRLGELATEEARALARSILQPSSPDAPALSAIVEEGGGIPFFVTELAQRERERRAEGAAGPGPERRGVALEELIGERVTALPDDARCLLEVLCIAARPLGYTLANAVAVESGRIAPDRLVAARAKLCALRLVRSYRGQEEEQAEPYHAKIRESVAERLPSSERRRWHVRLATALEANGGDAEAMVEHYLAAAQPERARRFVLQAARAASDSLAFLRAARLYELALALGADAPTHVLLRCRADALVSAGRGSEAAEVYLAAAEAAPREETIDLRRLAAEHYLKSGRDARGTAVLKRVLQDAGLSYPESDLGAALRLGYERARLSLRARAPRVVHRQRAGADELARVDVAFSATAGLSLIDVVRSAAFGAEHLRLALEVGEPRRLCRALALEASSRAAAGVQSRKRVRRLVRSAEALAQQSGDPTGLARARLAAGMAHALSGEWRSAQRVLEEAERLLREKCRSVHWELTNTLAWICNALILSGELKEAARRVPAILSEARERDDRHALMHMTYPACITRLAAGDVEGALAIATDDTPFRGLEGGRFTGGHWGGLISTLSVLRYEGQGGEAHRYILAEWPRLQRSQFLRVELMRACSLFERGLSGISAAESDESSRAALDDAERCGRRLLRERAGYGAAMGAYVLGGAAAARGARDLARSLFRTAYSELRAADMGYLAACAAARLGELAGGAEGDELTRRCQATFERQGIADLERCLAMSAPGFGRKA